MTEEAWASLIGQNVRQARESAGLTQGQAGEKADLAAEHISRLESGKHLPNLRTVIRVAEALGTTPAALLASKPKRSTP